MKPNPDGRVHTILDYFETTPQSFASVGARGQHAHHSNPKILKRNKITLRLVNILLSVQRTSNFLLTSCC